MDSFRQKAFSGTVWFLTSSLAQMGITTLIFLILARLLAPSDFGAVALVGSIIAILTVFAELGISVALVQRKNASPCVIDSAFVATVVSTSLIVALLWGCAETLSGFFAMSVLKKLLRIAAVGYVFQGLFSLYRSLLLREMRYKRISALNLFSTLIYSLTAVTLAIRGWGPFSLVWGQVFSKGFVLLGGVYSTSYVPKTFGTFREIWRLFGFGIWVSVNQIFGQASAHFDKFVIGRLLDAMTLGGYHLAQRLANEFPALFTGTINQVMLPIYSQWQNDPPRIQNGYWRSVRCSAIVVLPVCVFLAVFAEPVVLTLFGDKWHASVPIVRILSLSGAIQGIGGGIFSSVIYAVGRPSIVAIIGVFRIVTFPVCIYVGSYWGLEGIAWGAVAFGVLGRLFNQSLLRIFLQFSLRQYLRMLVRPILAASSMALLGASLYVLLPTGEFLPMVLNLALSACTTFVFYVWLIFKLLPEDSKFMYQELRVMFAGSNRRLSITNALSALRGRND